MLKKGFHFCLLKSFREKCCILVKYGDTSFVIMNNSSAMIFCMWKPQVMKRDADMRKENLRVLFEIQTLDVACINHICNCPLLITIDYDYSKSFQIE